MLPNSDNISEGLTDSNGVYVFETSKKDEFLTVVANKQGFFVGQRTFVKDLSTNKNTLPHNNNTSEQQEPEVQKDLIIVLVRETLVTVERSLILITYSNAFADNFDPLFMYSDKVSDLLEIQCSDTQKDIGILTAQFKLNPSKQYEFQDFEEICRLTLKIKNVDLLKTYEMNFKTSMNGLQKLNCECCIYTQNNVFFVQPPQYSREQKFEYWDVGFLDFKNHLFFELGQLLSGHWEKDTIFFNEWMTFLDMIIAKKNYLKLFELFGFNQAILTSNDRVLYEAAFLKYLRNFFGEQQQSVDFIIYLCDLMKANSGFISYSIFKRKITSNLKNFKEIKANLSN